MTLFEKVIDLTIAEWINWMKDTSLTLFRMGTFGAVHGWGGGKKAHLPKICHTYPAMMKLCTVIPYLKKIQKIYESRDTPLTSTDISFFHQKPANFNISRNTDTDCILVIISNSFSFSWVFKDLFNKSGYNFDDVSTNGYPRSS